MWRVSKKTARWERRTKLRLHGTMTNFTSSSLSHRVIHCFFSFKTNGLHIWVVKEYVDKLQPQIYTTGDDGSNIFLDKAVMMQIQRTQWRTIIMSTTMRITRTIRINNDGATTKERKITAGMWTMSWLTTVIDGKLAAPEYFVAVISNNWS